jgi:short-subunit dehydrogenase
MTPTTTERQEEMKAAGKTIAVTGAGNGIGRQLTLNLLQRGARVAAIDVSEAGLRETLALAGAPAGRLSTHVVNITERETVETLPAAIVEHHGQVDGVINCAGIIQPFVKLDDLDYSAIERVMNVNFWGLMYMTKTFLPHLLRRPVGHIVNVSSMGGFLPVPGQTVYGASKAAVKLLTEGLHSELTETNVGVTVVFPGAIATDISRNSGLNAPTAAEAEKSGVSKIKMTPPAEAARIIVDAMERDAYRVTVGKDATLMDRLCRLMPERAARIIYKQMRTLLAG